MFFKDLSFYILSDRAASHSVADCNFFSIFSVEIGLKHVQSYLISCRKHRSALKLFYVFNLRMWAWAFFTVENGPEAGEASFYSRCNLCNVPSIISPPIYHWKHLPSNKHYFLATVQ